MLSRLRDSIFGVLSRRLAKFGAVYTTLKFYEAWDKPWPVANQADIVINFDNNAHKFAFWRGTSYIPHWITENGIWYNNEFLETWDVNGCHEPKIRIPKLCCTV